MKRTTITALFALLVLVGCASAIEKQVKSDEYESKRDQIILDESTKASELAIKTDISNPDQLKEFVSKSKSISDEQEKKLKKLNDKYTK